MSTEQASMRAAPAAGLAAGSEGVVLDAPAARPPISWPQRVAGWLVLAAALAGLVWAVRRSSPQDLMGAGVSVLVVFAGAVASARYPRLRDAINRLFAAYMKFTLWLAVALAPLVLFRWLFNAVTWRLPLWAQIPAFLALGALLAWALWVIGTKRRREQLLERLRSAGRLMPLVYATNVLMIAAMFFASVTFILVRHGVVQLSVTGGDELVFGRLLDFYVWQFLDLVPLVKVNETLHWSQPLSYQAGLMGPLVLLFKVAVTVPIIGAFAALFEERARQQAGGG